MSKGKGSLTVFLGEDEKVLETMFYHSLKDVRNNRKVYIGEMHSKDQYLLELMHSIQVDIDEKLSLNHIYKQDVDVVVIENRDLDFDLQLQRCEDIQVLLNQGYDVYMNLYTKNFKASDNLVLYHQYLNADHVYLVDDSYHGDKNHNDALSYYLEWVNKKKKALDEGNEPSRILVCLSHSPSNMKVIHSAIQLASLHHSEVIALYVSSNYEKDNQIQKQLQTNMDLAHRLGAKVEMIYADDVAFQICEYAKSHHVSQIVIGRSAHQNKSLFKKQYLSDQILMQANNCEVYIVPVYEKYSFLDSKDQRIHTKDLLNACLILMLCTLISFLFFALRFNDSNIIMVYILGVFYIAITTANKSISMLSSVVSVIIFNFFFTYPTLSLSAYDTGYPMTFLIMFIVAFMTSHLASQIQHNALTSSQIAKRTKILLDTNQLLQKEMTKEGIVEKGCEQLYKLLKRNIIFYPVNENEIGHPYLFPNHHIELSNDEKEVVHWVAIHNKHGGASTKYYPNAQYLYLSIRVDSKVYGVVGIDLKQERLESFENDILLAILGEIAFALENEKVIRDKNQANLKAENEQLRADLLRSISHDLRTPLTSISGNADILMSHDDDLSKDNKHQLYNDIYDDSQWLIHLVENLLSVTRIEDGSMKLNMEPQMIEDVINEALNHVSRKKAEHCIDVKLDDDLLMAHMDVRLMLQVIINIVDNAIKYTPINSHIMLHAYQKKDYVIIDIADDGNGIPDDKKDKIFDKFYSANHKIIDSKRSLGLGLALCKSIMLAHGGGIEVKDHKPHGALFRLSLPAVHLDIKI